MKNLLHSTPRLIATALVATVALFSAGVASWAACQHATTNYANMFLVRTQPDTASAFDFLLGLTMKSTKQPFSVPCPTSHPKPLLGKCSVNAL
ncbi:hypothetical protein K438DRAFT_1966587 [Mycena galopus ATCC 62051]|nr:hypothetical protein K438DRAFT_1966587 [Mycena galopus ATCC 62051]